MVPLNCLYTGPLLEVVEGTGYLSRVEPGMLLGQSAMTLHVEHQITSIDTLYHKEQPGERGRGRGRGGEGGGEGEREREGGREGEREGERGRERERERGRGREGGRKTEGGGEREGGRERVGGGREREGDRGWQKWNNSRSCVLYPQTRGDGVDEEDSSGGGLVDEVGHLVCLLQGIQLPPTRPVLVVILMGIQVGVHTPFTHSGWDGTDV